ncbi:formylglycine-generating enzyme family protein [Lacticaseibacillus yichunensis]|uniref:Formylglycine-generating enzyme family protein n=1 Tax=Lacticaseibacillus yichunensis TaxID=2486015 RepID=A0ABW4CMM2_9LACO|nr:formylglycine-generating enzyme family protein [Lacticaseibacillus yichunensis]
MIRIQGGTYDIGTNADDGFIEDVEKPVTAVTVAPFEIGETTVTNADFAAFVKATGYQTDSERIGWSYVFHLLMSEAAKQDAMPLPRMEWWYGVRGATWDHPFGPDSTIENRLDHPVVQVSRNDAVAYCQWAGVRLPTEAEWEIAAKSGTTNTKWPWGDDALVPDGTYMANTFQGDFPWVNEKTDGFVGTAPVRSFTPNGYGLWQMIGNVWEWCVNPRYIPLADFQTTSGPAFWAQYQAHDDADYATKGGSFLCHESYCKRYRIAARNGNTGESASSNMGFRVVRDL